MKIPLIEPQPILKWAGGKRQLLPVILPMVPKKIDTYYEPFAGGLALFFALSTAKRRFTRAVLSDVNPGLVNLYTHVRDALAEVTAHLTEHAARHSKEHYLSQRPQTRDVGPEGAARFVYLNRTGFNGLYRVNKSGDFNVPFGNYANPRIVDVDGLAAASVALQCAEIVQRDFAVAAEATVGDFVYLDPPYLPASRTAAFVGFSAAGFGVEEHEQIASVMADAVRRGARVLLSNSDTAESTRIFGRPQWKLKRIMARRSISATGAERHPVGEILVSAPICLPRKKQPRLAGAGVKGTQ